MPFWEHCSRNNNLRYPEVDFLMNKREWLTQLQHCDISVLIHISVQITSVISSLLMCMTSQTELFAVSGGIEVMSRSEERLWTWQAVDSHSLCCFFLPPRNHLKIHEKKKKNILRLPAEKTYSNHWNIGSNCVTLCFLNKGLASNVFRRFALEYKCSPNKEQRGNFHSQCGKHSSNIFKVFVRCFSSSLSWSHSKIYILIWLIIKFRCTLKLN